MAQDPLFFCFNVNAKPELIVNVPFTINDNDAAEAPDPNVQAAPKVPDFPLSISKISPSFAKEPGFDPVPPETVHQFPFTDGSVPLFK